MEILIDSDALIEVQRGRNEAVVTKWRSLAGSEDVLLYSPVAAAELWHGARPEEHEVIEQLFSALICVPIDSPTRRRAGGYLRQYRRSHGVELGDALIAAAASLHHAALWTRGRRHYPMADVVFL